MIEVSILGPTLLVYVYVRGARNREINPKSLDKREEGRAKPRETVQISNVLTIMVYSF
ncbi:MAG: hypothetical protein JRN68_07095 [Nitrososphaerota archaeon]|nr:hypothetical protein [Nitrososphaerota archaeon]